VRRSLTQRIIRRNLSKCNLHFLPFLLTFQQPVLPSSGRLLRIIYILSTYKPINYTKLFIADLVVTSSPFQHIWSVPVLLISAVHTESARVVQRSRERRSSLAAKSTSRWRPAVDRRRSSLRAPPPPWRSRRRRRSADALPPAAGSNLHSYEHYTAETNWIKSPAVARIADCTGCQWP